MKLNPSVLAKYASTYGPFVISLVDDRLYMGDLPMFFQSETRFDTKNSGWEFNLDADGSVKSMTRFGALGDELRLDRKR